MIWADYYEEVAHALGEQVTFGGLLKDTYGSRLYLLKGEKEYVLKLSKSVSLSGEYRNHQCVYDLWSKCDGVGFAIPKPYFVGDDESYYVMEYVKAATGLPEILPKCGADSLDIYRRVGSSLRDYHEMMTSNFGGDKIPIDSHVYIEELLSRGDGNGVREILGQFTEDSYRAIFKDFTFSNVVLDADGRIYFIDFQSIDFFGPFYYDLARFVDTFKVFTFTGHPLFYVGNVGLIKKTVESFLDGYNLGLDKSLLTKMRKVHQQEHILTKELQKPLHGLILKCLYKVMR
jgi:hypothetical protein